MNQRRAVWHKVGYACAILVLLLPLSYLSQPATRDSQGNKGSPGGKLAQLREEYKLGQADLGEIDPTSEAIKLATLGMRGIAADIMWMQANEYKKTENWTAFSAALEQITRLQPNFIAVWRFQGWNLAYNISVEFDDYHDRYYWVIKGINFIIGGTKVNYNEPRLLYDVGWDISQKIGRADEHKQFRKLFKEDNDFFDEHVPDIGNLTPAERDNWLVGRRWYLKAQHVVDTLGIPVKGTSPLVFHSYPSMGLINYAEAIEDEGVYGEVAKNAWRKARDGWREFGDRDMPTTYNLTIHLNEQERFEEKARTAGEELDKLVPGAQEALRKERMATLPKEDDRECSRYRKIARSWQETIRANAAESKIKPSYYEIADKADKEHRVEALRLADAAAAAENQAQIIDRYRDIVNFEYWQRRCEMEQTEDALAARKLVFDADALFRNSDLEVAKAKYDEGLEKWAAVLKAYPQFKDESTFMDDIREVIDRYRKLLDQLDLKLPEDFILKDALKPDQVAPQPEKETGDVTGDPSQPDDAAEEEAGQRRRGSQSRVALGRDQEFAPIVGRPAANQP